MSRVIWGSTWYNTYEAKKDHFCIVFVKEKEEAGEGPLKILVAIQVDFVEAFVDALFCILSNQRNQKN